MYIAFNLYSENENGSFLGISDTLEGLYNYLIDEIDEEAPAELMSGGFFVRDEKGNDIPFDSSIVFNEIEDNKKMYTEIAYPEYYGHKIVRMNKIGYATENAHLMLCYYLEKYSDFSIDEINRFLKDIHKDERIK